MKDAYQRSSGTIEATADAPSRALCPKCGGVVLLRKRKLMNNAGSSYYWQHQRNANRQCGARWSTQVIRPASR